ncbi:MAG: hypothetical protein Fues2KO_16850 [Fuerstiella sp.]
MSKPLVFRRLQFRSGSIFITRNARERLNVDEVRDALSRHLSGDWGDVCDEDRQENELSLREGFRLLSVYHASDGTKFWVITEADRSSTTVLLPEDY